MKNFLYSLLFILCAPMAFAQITAPATTGMVAPIASGAGTPSTFLTCNAASNNLEFTNTSTGQKSFCNGTSWVNTPSTLAGVTSLQVGGATALTYAGLITSNSVTPGSIGAAGCADVSYTFTGTVTGSTMGFPRLATGTTVNATNIEIVGYVVTAANTVAIRYCNASTLSAQTPTAGALTAFFAW